MAASNRPRRFASNRMHICREAAGALEAIGEDCVDYIEDDATTLDTPRAPVKKKVTSSWVDSDKAVYEEQLEKMQEQLIATMIEKQMLEEERKKWFDTNLKKEIEKLQRENKELQRKLNSSSSAAESSERALDRLSEAASVGESSLTGREGSMLSVASTLDGWESVSVQSHSSGGEKRKGAVPAMKDLFFDYLSDFTIDVRSPDSETREAPSLTAKRLKENLSRLAKSSKPVRGLGTFIQDVLQWKNTAESLVAFLIYMYCVWNGWLFPLLLFLSIAKLTLNYLCVSGLAEQFGFSSMEHVKENEYVNLGLTDKIHLVKQVAQTVQNLSGIIADNLEKAQNLLLWRHPEATRQLYIFLWSFFLLSLVIPNSYLLTAIGLGLGFKMFIIENIFNKYPKVKERHDSVARLWASLPTDAQLEQRQALSEDEVRESLNSPVSSLRSPSTDSIDGSSASGMSHLSEEEVFFCQRFQLSADELPLPSWQDGKKCTSLDRDKPLIGSKAGKVFLTHSFLCFEKSSKSKESGDRFLIPLADIICIKKAKPFGVLPGSGMAIEIILNSVEKPVILGAILHRDQVLQSILDQGLILGLPWCEAEPTKQQKKQLQLLESNTSVKSSAKWYTEKTEDEPELLAM